MVYYLDLSANTFSCTFFGTGSYFSKAKEFASVNWRRMAGVTIRILLVILPALILQFWSIWYRRADEIVPRGLLLVKFVRRADGKKNGILALMK